MLRLINLEIEELEEGGFVATSEDVQGLVAEAETIPELLELVPKLVNLLEEVRRDLGWEEETATPLPKKFTLPFVLAA